MLADIKSTPQLPIVTTTTMVAVANPPLLGDDGLAALGGFAATFLVCDRKDAQSADDAHK
jgi:hypothetical protein